jgi:uncharacterized OB-fold protein
MSIPQPEITPVNEPHWQGLREGRLMIQRCTACGHHWMPAREDCPNCLGDSYEWVRASGKGRLISWVVYHTAFNKAFAGRVPYSVAVVELEEGARAITNIVNWKNGLKADQPVELAIEEEDGVALARVRAV